MQSVIGIYVRVSRKGDREDDRFHSPKEQAERAKALIEAKGLVAGPVFEDIDVSGATPPAERPAMSRLLQQIHDGRLTGIAAFSLDRLSREPAHGDQLVKAVTKAGGIVLTPDIPDAIDSPTGEFTFGMLLQVAKLYRSQAGARFTSAKERAILAGIPVGAIATGYRPRRDRKLELDPELAPVIRQVFERRAAGAGWTALAELLSDATGRTWSRQGVANLIKNRLYATGHMEYGAVVSEWDAGAIVDEPLWHAAQRAQSGPRPKRSPESVWLLTGMARCATCGHSLSPWTGATRRRRDPRRGKNDWVEVVNPPRRYRCVNHACTAHASVDAGELARLALLQAAAVGAELEARGRELNLSQFEEAVAVAERRLEQVLAPEARDALGDLWPADVKARRAELDAALAQLGEARNGAGLDKPIIRPEDISDPADVRNTLGLYWKQIRVAPSNGSTHVTFVARGPGAETAIELAKGGE